MCCELDVEAIPGASCRNVASEIRSVAFEPTTYEFVEYNWEVETGHVDVKIEVL